MGTHKQMGASTMTMQLNHEASRDQEMVYYPAVNGRFGRIFATVLLGMLTAGPLWLLFLCLNQLRILAGLDSSYFDDLQLVADPSTPWQVVWCGVALLPVTLMFGWFTVTFAVRGIRSAREDWWIRLSSRGFEVNDRLFKPRRYEWREIDEFMLVTAYDHTEAAVPAPAKTFAKALKDGDTRPSGWIVGYHYSPGHRRTLANKLWRIMSGARDRDGTKTDGLVMGYWDRPFDEAVDLMNEWLTRYKAV
jgi:hypothetical protein